VSSSENRFRFNESRICEIFQVLPAWQDLAGYFPPGSEQSERR
jgi:hypothetical protein